MYITRPFKNCTYQSQYVCLARRIVGATSYCPVGSTTAPTTPTGYIPRLQFCGFTVRLRTWATRANRSILNGANKDPLLARYTNLGKLTNRRCAPSLLRCCQRLGSGTCSALAGECSQKWCWEKGKWHSCSSGLVQGSPSAKEPQEDLPPCVVTISQTTSPFICT